jgi:hypothetical protein
MIVPKLIHSFRGVQRHARGTLKSTRKSNRSFAKTALRLLAAFRLLAAPAVSFSSSTLSLSRTATLTA